MKYKRKIIKFIKKNYKKLGLKSFKSIKLSELGIGENNLNVLAEIDEKNFVFRTSMRKELEKNMQKEFKILKNIHEGFGPEPVYFDKTKKYLPKIFSVLKFIQGKHIKKWTKKHLEIHAKKLAKLHSKRFKTKKISLYKGLLEEIRFYKGSKFLEDSFVKKIIGVIKKHYKENDYLFDKIKNGSRIHGDLYLDNIIFKKDNVRYLDWEWSKIGDNAVDLTKFYYMDLKILPWFMKLSKEKEDFFIKTYLKYLPFEDSTLKKRMKVWQNSNLLNDFLYVLWKLENWHKEEKGKSKKFYQNAAKLMKKTLGKRFL